MLILAIDPGNIQSALVTYDTEKKIPTAWEIFPNEVAIYKVANCRAEHLAIEMIACYGMAVGKTVFDTCVWIGRFIEAFNGPHNRVLRKGSWGPGADTTGKEGIYTGVCKTICRNNNAKDTNVRQALLDMFPATTGGGKTPQIGTKGQPGPLYGMKADMWAALGVAVTWAEQTGDDKEKT